MPPGTIQFYEEKPGDVPVLDWLRKIRGQDRKSFEKCIAAISHLGDFGYELRRPHTDYLRDGIYELRAKKGRVNYRILYFFHGQNVAILGHALTKEAKVSPADIQRAIERKKRFESDPEAHTYEGESNNVEA